MTDIVHEPSRTPGIVIFVAILNFISVSFFLLLSMISVMALIFGNVMGVYDAVARQMAHYAPSQSFTYGATLVFGSTLLVCGLFMAYFLFIGIGLLRGKAVAWYLQIAMSVLGLVLFPIGTVLNTVILIFFFQPNVRDTFKV